MPVSEVVTGAIMISQANPSVGGVQAASKAAIQICEIVRQQGRALEESCEKGSIRDTLLAAKWHRANFWLGLCSAVAATVVAFAVGRGNPLLQQFIEWLIQHFHRVDPGAAKVVTDDVVAILALTSAILTSTLTFLVPSERAGSYHQFSNKLRALRDKARSFVEIDCARAIRDAALCDKFERLVREKSEIDASHPIVPHWAFDKSYAEFKKKLNLKQSLREIQENRR
jgi:hypothetical protein